MRLMCKNMLLFLRHQFDLYSYDTLYGCEFNGCEKTHSLNLLFYYFKLVYHQWKKSARLKYTQLQMEASEPKWVNSNDIKHGVNSLRLRDLQLYNFVMVVSNFINFTKLNFFNRKSKFRCVMWDATSHCETH